MSLFIFNAYTYVNPFLLFVFLTLCFIFAVVLIAFLIKSKTSNKNKTQLKGKHNTGVLTDINLVYLKKALVYICLAGFIAYII